MYIYCTLLNVHSTQHKCLFLYCPFSPLQIFDIAKPGCQGRIEESDVKYITHEQLEEIHDYITEVEDEFFGNIEEEEEEQVGEFDYELHNLFGDMDIPGFAFDMEEGLGKDDGSHIMVDQVYTADSAGEDQDGTEKVPSGGTDGSAHPASDDHKPSDSTREEL